VFHRLTLALLLLLPSVVHADLRQDQWIAAEVDRDAVTRIKKDVEVRYLAGSLEPPTMDSFAALAQKGVTDIGRFPGVHRDASQRIVIYVSPRVEISHTWPRYPRSPQHEARLYLDSERVSDGDAPYLHELVHAVVGDTPAMWLSEGLAEWVASSVADQYGGYYAPVLSATNARVDGQARAVLTSYGSDTARAWFLSNDPDLGSQGERRSLYILAHSFVQFLGTKVGMRTLVQVHQSEDPVAALSHLTGASLDEWWQRWADQLRR
jgi:hypothetical protein